MQARAAIATLTADATPVARPFVKWAGGKSQLLPELRKHVPDRIRWYIEPFVGGGALFFDLYARGRLKAAILSDANTRLIRTYQALRGNVDNVLERLRDYSDLYARATRADARRGNKDNSSVRRLYFKARKDGLEGIADDNAMAAWVIFMLKAGFNGIWRENKKGEYNVPPGKFRTPPTICDEPTLRACSNALSIALLKSVDFEKIAKHARRGDFWYADPPYVPLSATSDFTSYTRDPFGPAAQERLRDTALRLKKQGVNVLLSNSDSPFVRKLYRKGFELRRVLARRSINSATEKRGPVRELLIW